MDCPQNDHKGMNINGIPHNAATDSLAADADPENMGPPTHTTPSVTGQPGPAPVNLVFPPLREATQPIAIEDPTQPERDNEARQHTTQMKQHGLSESNEAVQQPAKINVSVDAETTPAARMLAMHPSAESDNARLEAADNFEKDKALYENEAAKITGEAAADAATF